MDGGVEQESIIYGTGAACAEPGSHGESSGSTRSSMYASPAQMIKMETPGVEGSTAAAPGSPSTLSTMNSSAG